MYVLPFKKKLLLLFKHGRIKKWGILVGFYIANYHICHIGLENPKQSVSLILANSTIFAISFTVTVQDLTKKSPLVILNRR
jgi:hypothetical protein